MEHSAKILLLGKTKAGKSSFINYFLGKNVAKSGAGKPITPQLIPYEIEDGRYPIIIYDSKGLEALDAHNQLEQIIEEVKKRNSSNDIFDWFHTIFYCISMEDSRFQDFEVKFIQRLQKELAQHIHIILTHCDSCEPNSILRMRERITHKLGDLVNVEIFEVVCVSMEKRNGEVIKPRGKEVISERVFDLLLEDIAHKISCDYARSLREALRDVAYRTLLKIENLIDNTINLKTLIDLFQNEEELNDRLDTNLDEIEKELERVKNEIDQRFNQILQPAAQLYASYRNVVDNSFADNVQLDFMNALDWGISTEDWLDNALDEKVLITKIFPQMFKKGYVNAEGDFSEDDSLLKMLQMITTGIGDLLHVKKRLKDLCKDIYCQFIASIPSELELQKEAYIRIVKFIKPKR